MSHSHHNAMIFCRHQGLLPCALRTKELTGHLDTVVGAIELAAKKPAWAENAVRGRFVVNPNECKYLVVAAVAVPI